MPRELGPARIEDLTGHLPGESVDRVAPLAKFLISMSQLVPPQASGVHAQHGRAGQRDTEVPQVKRPADPAADTVFDAPTLRPAGKQSVQALSHELEPSLDPDPEDEVDAPTDLLPRRSAPAPTPAWSSPSETGVLTMEASPLPREEQLTTEELRADDDTHLRVGRDPSEKETNRVTHRAGQPTAPMRDTVNFYNQTQSLQSAQSRRSPPVEGTVPIVPRPREFADLPSRRYVPPPPLPITEELPVDQEALEPVTGFAQEAMTPDAADTARSPEQHDTDRYGVAEKSAPRALQADTQKLEMQPEAPLPARVSDPAADTTFDISTAAPAAEKVKGPPTLQLPPAQDVAQDFELNFSSGAGDRIVPEFQQPDSVEPQRITEKVRKLDQPPPPPPQVAVSRASDSTAQELPVQEAVPVPMDDSAARPFMPRYSEQVTKRHDVSTEETANLLREAGTLALKLRKATEQSRTDLLAISSRQPVTDAVLAGSQAVSHDTSKVEPPSRSGSRRTRTVDDDSRRLMSDMPTSRSRRPRVPTQAIHDILGALDAKMGGDEAPLSDLLKDVSRRITKQVREHTGDVDTPSDLPGDDLRPGRLPRADDDEDLDHLVAASAALREVMEDDNAMAHGRTPTEVVPALGTGRVVAETPLARDLDLLWRELSVRKKTAVVPKPEAARIAQQPARAPGQSQGALWSMLFGIAVASFLLGGLFLWLMHRFWQSS